MRRFTQIVFTLLILFTSGVEKLWAVGTSDIYIFSSDNGSISVGEVETLTGGDFKVTLTAVPNSGYTIAAKDFSVLPADDPSQAPKRRTLGVASELEVSDESTATDRIFSFILPKKYAGAMVTAYFTNITPISISDISDITNPSGNYKLNSGFSVSGSRTNNIGSSSNPFRGSIEGYIYDSGDNKGQIDVISLSTPLFDYVKDATIKNIVVEGTISGSGNVGAIAGNALGASRIYNCGVIGTITTLTDAEGKPVKDTEGNYQYTYGSTIDGNNNVGSIVGLLDGSSRVINCFSFAKIMSGSNKGGIVGYNNSFSESGDIQTMVMNCMFYGDIASGNTISPVYGGNTINNVNDVDNTKVGLNTYNYYRYESLYSKKKSITTGKYNCALAVKEQYLTRFEIYRQLLNSNRKLAAWYATGDAEKGKGKQNEMAKWVLDKSKAPYPILMSQAYYPSVVNYDEDKTYDATGAKVDRSNISVRSQGGYIEKENATQKLTINISLGSGAPTNATIISDKSQITRKRIDKDTLNYNFNYDKVQLPYFSEVGTGNYGVDANNKSRVVTGWKITGFGGNGTEGTFSKTDDYGGYNFADRNCTNKDLYSVSGRVFSQGAYFDVPYGVTSINIEPFWGYAAYVSDPYYDVVYKTNYTTPKDVTDMGVQNNYNTKSKNGSISIGGSTQTVYTSVATAVNSLPGLPTGTTAEVYHYAVVLVGNMHLIAVPATVDRPFTIMSADLDEDREPDYSLIYSHASRTNGAVSPIRFDFINVPGTAMAQKPNGASLFRNVSIFKPKGWFEITNTCQISIVQFEYDNGGKSAAPVILLGGEFEQFVSTQSSTPTVTQYIHVGGNAWFKEFNNGTHSDGTKFTPHIPISATGGDYDKFYLSGAYKPDAEVSADNAEGYISGGRFGEMAGAGQQQIDGDVHWQIYDADIRDFYGGGINSDKPITGNITVDIYNSHVKTYCGGPKFGDNDKTVTTNATGCTFGDYFGAGYGGIAYVRKRTQDAASLSFGDWISNYTDNRGNYYNGTSTKIGDNSKGEKAGPGVAVDFDYEFFVWSTGETGGRFYIKYASLSFATTNDVNSTLNNCHITHNFYGGGNLGKVDGNATSALNGCTVDGEVFGAGYSANRPKVPYRDGGFSGTAVPGIDTDAGVFTDGVKVTITDDDYLTLEPGKTLTNAQPALGSGTMYTNYTEAQLNSLGTVAGKVTLTIDNYAVNSTTTKETSITGNVYGGGESSDVYGVNSSSVVTSEVEVNIKGGSMVDVYGGGKGKTTVVGGDVTVNIGKLKDGSTNVYEGNATVTGSVYGGSALGVVNAKKDTDWDKETNPDDLIFIDGKETKVNILKGTVNGSVYGGGLGDLASLGTDHSDVAAKVFGDVTVTVGAATETAATTVPIIEGSVYGGSNVNGVLEKGARVDIISGTIGKETTTSNTTTLSGGNVHGGGYGQPTLVKGDVTVNVGVETNDTPAKHYGFATIKGDVYGGSAKGNVNATPNSSDVLELTSANVKTDVNLYGGTINGDLYGGGLGYLHSSSETESDDVAANVYGNVTVTVEGGKANRVFGCNNKFGTPKESVTVTINGTAATEVNETTKTYALQGVYGGGNLAHYDPTTPGNYPTVTVNGCSTSIEDVFGGGNAAAVPYTNVTINGGDINRVFAGGNGSSGAANVGYKNSKVTPTVGEDEYGTGTSNATIAGGTINEIYGGSNSKGTVRASGTLSIAKPSTGTCPMKIGSVYGGGNQASGAAVALSIGCTGTTDEDTGITNVFGGANAANITGDILLNITEGKIANVYGGNNSSGSISGTITVNIEKAANPCIWNIGNVYGGGKLAPYGDADHNKGNYPVVNIKNGTVSGSVFGGGFGSTAVVYGNPQVTIGHATEGYDADVTGDVYGGGDAAAVEGTPVVHVINKDNTSIGNVYGGGNAADVSATSVTIDGGTIGLVFGGGHGDKNSDPQKAANVSGNVAVAINGGTITKVFGGSNSKGDIGGTITLGIEKSATASTMKIGEVYGGGNEADGNAGTITIGCTGTWTTTGEKNHTNHNNTDNRIGYELEGIGTVYGGANAANIGTSTAQSNISLTIGGGIIENVYGGNNTSGAISGTIDVNINKDDNATCADNWYVGNVYGGGNLAAYSGSPTVTVTNGLVSGRVFGGGNQANVGGSTVNINGGGVGQGVYGGCNTSGTIGGAVTVTVKGGTLGSSSAIEAITDKTPKTLPNILFGGGKGSGTSVTGLVTLNVGEASSDNALIYGNVYGGSEEGEVSVANVNLNGNTIQGNVFGGGYRTAEGKISATNVTVTLDGTTFDRTYDGTAQIFGANNVQGSPTGHVLVHVKNTAPVSGQTYDIAAVYGGGNNADYDPTDTKQSSEVIIEGCTNTSIQNVYGGGNAAAVPATEVWILGATKIFEVFGGGNGEAGAAYAAHVGYHRTSATAKTDYAGGNGKTYVKLVGGTINTVYGGSNSNGDIRGGSDISMPTVDEYKATHTDTPNCCSTLTTTNIYGGGKNADMSGGTTIKLGCIDGLDNVFGGAKAANIKGGVNLVITGGTFANVFGGNDTSGTIQGPIKLYIEESCAALNITNLYLGGNLAPYSVYGYKQGTSGLEPRINSTDESPAEGTVAPGSTGKYDDPELYVTKFTKIDNVFGGGYGSTAVMYGSPTVYINEVPNIAGNIGEIGNVFGGGEQANVVGNASINIGTSSSVYMKTDETNHDVKGVNITGNIYGGGNAADIEGDATVTIGTVNLISTSETDGKKGTTIGGSVFGGGLGDATTVTGSVSVNIGGNDGTAAAPSYVGYASITGDIYGGSAKGKVNATKSGTTVTYTASTGTTNVNLYGGTIVGNLYGGGYGKDPVTSGETTYNADVYGAVTVGVYGGSVTNVFGCNNISGAPQNTVTVAVDGGTINNNVYGGGNVAAYTVETNPTKDSAGNYKKYPAVNINNGTVIGNVFGGGLGTTATVTGNPQVTVGDEVSGHVIAIKKSVYGGGEMAAVDGSTNVAVSKGTIGTPKEDLPSGTTAGAVYGNVYGGGLGSDGTGSLTDLEKVQAGLVKGNTKITISGTPAILHNVYGGGAYGSVGTFIYDTNGNITPDTNGNACADNTGKAEIIITGGTFGTTGSSNGMIFGSSRGDVGAPGAIHDKLAWVYDTDVKIGTEGSGTDFTTPTIKGSVYGGGENGHVFNDADVYIYSGTVGIPSGETIGDYSGAAYPYRGNVYGGGCGTDKYYTDLTNVQDPTDGNGNAYNPLAGIVQGNTRVNISGGHVVRNVYGAGAMGSVGTASDANSGKTTITVTGGRIGYDGNSNNDGNIFGAARGDLAATGDNLAQVRETEVNISYETTPTADNEDKNVQLIAGSVFGGGEAGKVKGSVAVNMTGGLVLKDVYGGGALANTQTSNWNPTGGTSGKGGWATGKTSASSTTTVRLTGGTILGEAYGGALGQKNGVNGATSDIAAYVYGDVLLDLNGTTSSGETGAAIDNTAKGCVVGQVFGCNNINGSPKGDVMVHVYATQNAAATQIANTAAVEASGDNPAVPAVENAKVLGHYDMEAVYGGGNMAAYVPVTPNTEDTSQPNTSPNGSRTQVIIEGCTLTSIETVYGGGNAAAVPETNVVIKGAYEIGYLFGGGNGKDKILINNVLTENPGADIGQYHNGTEMVAYGTGNANSRMEAGLIHEAYGGSNTKGVLKGSINQVSDPKNPEDEGYCCELVLEKIVGAGKYADIDGDVNMTLSCQPSSKVDLLFAGADEANVNGNITLNITNGHFGKVFGGNNLGGAVKGKITVNVEETECQPIKIDNLYLGGNQAAYSVYGYYESNETHPVTGLKILKPRTAEMHAITDPTAAGYKAPVANPTEDATHTFPYAQPELNIISCTYIGNVFGGGLGKPAKMYANPTVNVNMVAGRHAATAVPAMMEELHLDPTETAPNPDNLGIIRNVYGGGDAADVEGNTTVNIAVEYVVKQVNEGANVTGYYTRSGAGTTADPFVYTAATGTAVEGKTYYEKKANQGSAYIIGSVFGGGNAADVLGNTNVTMSDGYVFNGIFGGGYAGNVGTFTRSSDTQYTNVFGHTAHASKCIGKPISCKAGTGKCTVLVNGGQIGPISVAKDGMTRASGPVPEGWVWGAGQGLIEDPAVEPDTHFKSYVGSTDVTIGGTALIMESIIGGGEFGRVLGNTLVKIEGGQIGVGAGKFDANNKPIRYTDDQFVNPLTTTITNDIALAECSHFPYGNSSNEYLPYDPYYGLSKYSTYVSSHTDFGPASTTSPSDGKTWIGCVFGGGSGYMPYEKEDGTGYDWCPSAGLVEGDAEVRISGGHILTNVYGGNEVTDVKGKSIVKMTGGTIGVPRTLAQIAAHPLSCYLFGAGKGDERSHFYDYTNVGSVEVDISGGIIYGSVFGGSEDGHVNGDISLTISKGDDFTIGSTTYTNGPIIGTWGTSYVDGNVFGAGRGFSGNTLTAGNVGGNVTLNITGGNILGSVYGGGRLASVGTYLVPSTDDNYGKMIADNDNATHGHVTIDISGGTIGNRYEYAYYAPNTTIDKTANHIPYTEFDATTNRLTHTKGGNVFTGAMGRLYALNGTTVLPRWLDLGKVKSTKLTVSGSAVIKSSIYGGGELGWTTGTHKTSDNKDVSTEISITGGTIGSEITDNNVVQYTYGSVFGGGYGNATEMLTDANSNKTYPKFQAGRVMNSTAVTMSSGTVKASVYGGGELANVGYGFYSYSQDGLGETAITQASDAANTYVTVSGGTIGRAPTGNTYFGGATMGNVYGGGSGNKSISRCGLVLGNTNVNISGTNTRIYHNIYGGGAYGSVGDYEYTTGTDDPNYPDIVKVFGINGLHTPGTGTANVSITGGTIGYDGKDNGMVFGSSRGDVQGEDSRDDYMAWVNDAIVTIGTSSSTTGPHVKGSVYGSGENGHVFHNTNVKIYSGTIGIDNASTSVEGYTVTSGGTTYNGPEYPSRGNVYGGGCGTDTYTKNNKEYFNPTAGIVKGNTTVTMTGGHVVRAVYGGGSMGSVGTFTNDENGKPISCVEAAEAVPATDTTPAVPAVEGTGLCTVTIRGGKIGPTTMAMPNYYGNVFGAGRGEVHDPADYPNLETSAYFNRTAVTIDSTAFVKGSVYGGAESGHVLNDTHVVIDGNSQIGCGKNATDRHGDDVWASSYVPIDAVDLECVSWPFAAPYAPYDKFAKTTGYYDDNKTQSADNARPTGSDGHTFYGNVFGGGSGSTPYAAGKWLPTAGWVEGNTTVEIKGGHILTSVYGGNEMSDVGAGGVKKMTDLTNETADMFYDITKSGGKCTVKMIGGTIGVPRTLAQIAAHPLTCYLFGAGKGDQRIFFNKTTNVKEVEVEVSGGKIYGSVFGGGEDGHVMKDVKMTIKDNANIGTWGTSYVDGNVFGGGRGFSGEALTAGNVGGSVQIDITGGSILGSVYGGGRLGSVGYGLYLVDETVDDKKPYGVMRDDNYDDRGNEVAGFKRGYITINISGGTIGNDNEYIYNPTAAQKAAIPNTTFDSENHLQYTKGGNVFTGGMGRLYALDNSTLLTLWPKLGKCKQTTLNMTGGTVKSSVYGGGEIGAVAQNATVNIKGGTVGTKVVDSEDATKYYNFGNVFGGGKGSVDNITYPSATPEAEKIPISEAGTTGGNVTVNLNEGVLTNKSGAVVNQVFGCNDMNGSPKGNVTVHVYATQNADKGDISTKYDKNTETFDVEAVYGGGNLAAYEPTSSTGSTNVIIDGCGLTSIRQVYGGGNAASTPATNVTVNGTYEILELFGGGNGFDKLPDGRPNPGANVGYKNYTVYENVNEELVAKDDPAYDTKEERTAPGSAIVYGSGRASLNVYGGTIHRVFGGSNTKGNVRQTAVTLLEESGGCEFCVDEAYGGGKSAEMDAEAKLLMACIPGLEAAYGGAEAADVHGNVTLNITNGTFDRVFGGNNLSGTISGAITVNIEEVGCRPIIIGELYGGGNQAGYSVYGYDSDGKPIETVEPGTDPLYEDPQVNVKSFTSIGKVFGGGFGEGAKMVGNPTVNVNEVYGRYYNQDVSVVGEDAKTSGNYPIPSHEKGKMGAISEVFGGGNAAKVIGNTTVNIATAAEVYIVKEVTAGANLPEGCYTRSGEGTTASPFVYTAASGTASATVTYYEKKTVLGADIRGNVYGGGNNAEVTGNANVNIGKKEGN